MKKAAEANLYEAGLSRISDEERIIDSIVLKMQNLSHENLEVLGSEIRNDLLGLKEKVGASDFKTRYLNSREKAMQQFIDDFPSMLGYWNKELVNVHSNKAYATYFGKSPSEIRGKTIAELLGDRIFDLNLPYINGVLSGLPQTFERDIPTPNKGLKSTLANYIPHFVNDEVIGFFVIVTDITEKKQLEEKTKALEASLYEQSRLSSLGQMASGIAHEINNPVAIIYSYACLLTKEFSKPKPNKEFIGKKLSEIESTALRIEKIVDGLRSLHVGRSSASVTAHSLNRIVEQVLAICSSRFMQADLKVGWDAPDPEIEALCNDTQVSEILLNILNNAYDALKSIEHGRVDIRVLKSNVGCEVRLSNNGPTIKAEDRKKIFLPFFSTKGRNGSGLGLKISKDLAKANGGDLRLSEGEETEFILVLPSK